MALVPSVALATPKERTAPPPVQVPFSETDSHPLKRAPTTQGVLVWVAVSVGVPVSVRVEVPVAVGVEVGVSVGRGDEVSVEERVGVAVELLVAVGATVGVSVEVRVEVPVGVKVRVLVGARVAVFDAVGVIVVVKVRVAVALGFVGELFEGQPTTPIIRLQMARIQDAFFMMFLPMVRFGDSNPSRVRSA
jgi:hypothetical protein